VIKEVLQAIPIEQKHVNLVKQDNNKMKNAKLNVKFVQNVMSVQNLEITQFQYHAQKAFIQLMEKRVNVANEVSILVIHVEKNTIINANVLRPVHKYQNVVKKHINVAQQVQLVMIRVEKKNVKSVRLEHTKMIHVKQSAKSVIVDFKLVSPELKNVRVVKRDHIPILTVLQNANVLI